jgi:preprotein translocase subunit YajC
MSVPVSSLAKSEASSVSSATPSNTTEQVVPSVQQAPKPNILIQSLPLVLMVVFFYLFFIRPQQKKSKELKEMLSNLKIGKKILTSGGIYGTISDVDQESDLVKIEIAKNVKVVISKASIVSVFSHDLDLNPVSNNTKQHDNSVASEQ